jgi:hypothetical protein
MSASRLVGLAFVALAAILFSVDRIAAQYLWGIHKTVVTAAITVHGGSFSHSPVPDISSCYQNPATWSCLVIGVLLITLGREARRDL